MGPSSPWIHSRLVSLSQVSLRQMLHSTLPRNSNKGPALVFVLLPLTTSQEEAESKQICVEGSPGEPVLCTHTSLCLRLVTPLPYHSLLSRQLQAAQWH